MKRVFMAMLMVMFFSSSVLAFDVPGLGGNKSGGGFENAMAAQAGFVGAYVAGNKYDFEAKALAAEALGLKEEAATLKIAAESINEGNAKDIPATKTKTEDAQGAIDKKMAESKELTAESKALLGKSLLNMANSVINYKKASELSKGALTSAQSAVKGTSPMNMPSVKKDLDPIFTIGPKMPGDLASVIETASRYSKFARSAGVEPPDNLKSALGEDL